MNEMEEKLGAILGNPEMMSQIMSMAQSLGQNQPQNQPQNQSQSQSQFQDNSSPPSMPDFDPAMIQKIMSMTQKIGIDGNQRALLHALGPYLSNQRLAKLEKAMRAARLADVASSALGQLNSGR